MYRFPHPVSTTGRLLARKPVRVCAAAVALATSGCGLLSPEDTGLVTDGTSFRLERVGGGGGQVLYRVDIPYSFTNRTGSTVYIPNCGGEFVDIALEVKKAGAWVPAGARDIVLCYDPPVVIEPDEVYRDTYTIVYTSGQILELLPARYRIVWGLALSSYDEDTYPFGEQIPLEERVSNGFEVDG